MTYVEFFKKATGNTPYPYQVTLGENAELPTLLRIPTGVGKTEAAILGWLYRRFEHQEAGVRDSTPIRMVYCLPMRTLVEQTVERMGKWLANLGMSDQVEVVTLMGGEPRYQWYLKPEKPTIIIGTQDMLLSRALNRGYGSSPFMWPVEYGLLNNDCLWVMDEVQLMEHGLSTSLQLAGLRGALQTYGPTRSMWMSATVRPGWLDTIDHPAPRANAVLGLSDEDMANPNFAKRHNACKMVEEASVSGGRNYARNFAMRIVDNHKPGTLTLAILNTVGRAQEVFDALHNLKRSRRTVEVTAEKILVHSRFREADRANKNTKIAAPVDCSAPGRIVIATQAVEAGVDISARTLITELAPWPSMVQRFGRCNREGKFERGAILWVNVNDNNSAPYERDALRTARELMRNLEGKSVSPAELEERVEAIGDMEHRTVIRRRDVIGLFDTTPDLSGSYLDVSQYVRGGDERDVTVFWRDNLDSGANSPERHKPTHAETVNVPIGEFREFLGSEGRRAWTWDFLDDQFRRVQRNELYPGMAIAMDSAHGGYSTDVGWLPSLRTHVVEIQSDATNSEDGLNSDPNSTAQPRWVTLADHSRNVEDQVRRVLDSLSAYIADPPIREAVETAALFHDAGKAHCAFQSMLRDGRDDPPPEGELWAKSPGSGKMDANRRHFRHEVGSALAILQHATDLDDRTRNLAAYLAASHHGKVRLGMRSLPGRNGRNPVPNQLLGYHTNEVEVLPSMEFGNGKRIPETELDMAIAEIGMTGLDGRSWIDRSLGLLEWLGPFRLAYLEAIVRAADMRASKQEREEAE